MGLEDEIYDFLVEGGPAPFSEIRSATGEGAPKETYVEVMRMLLKQGDIDIDVDDNDRVVFYVVE